MRRLGLWRLRLRSLVDLVQSLLAHHKGEDQMRYFSGPIKGGWPDVTIVPGAHLGPGDFVVIDDGLIRKARDYERGARLPEGSEIKPGGTIDVPAWWWWLHFRERLYEPLDLDDAFEDRQPIEPELDLW
jgi:hypothetical protein